MVSTLDSFLNTFAQNLSPVTTLLVLWSIELRSLVSCSDKRAKLARETFYEQGLIYLNFPNKIVFLQPADIEWKLIKQGGDEKPSARSGHTLSWIGG